jgi:hypothetical protein
MNDTCFKGQSYEKTSEEQNNNLLFRVQVTSAQLKLRKNEWKAK